MSIRWVAWAAGIVLAVALAGWAMTARGGHTRPEQQAVAPAREPPRADDEDLSLSGDVWGRDRMPSASAAGLGGEPDDADGPAFFSFLLPGRGVMIVACVAGLGLTVVLGIVCVRGIGENLGRVHKSLR